MRQALAQGLPAADRNYTLVIVTFMPVSAVVVTLMALSTIGFLNLSPIDDDALRGKA